MTCNSSTRTKNVCASQCLSVWDNDLVPSIPLCISCRVGGIRWVRVSSAAGQTSGRRAARINKNPIHAPHPSLNCERPRPAVRRCSDVAAAAAAAAAELLQTRARGRATGADVIVHETLPPSNVPSLDRRSPEIQGSRLEAQGSRSKARGSRLSRETLGGEPCPFCDSLVSPRPVVRALKGSRSLPDRPILPGAAPLRHSFLFVQMSVV